MKNPTIIDKFIKKLNNDEEINYNDEEFQIFLNTYDVNKHTISTNTKVYLLLAHKLNEILNIVYNKYINNVISAEYNEYYNPTAKELFDVVLELIRKNARVMDGDEAFRFHEMLKNTY